MFNKRTMEDRTRAVYEHGV